MESVFYEFETLNEIDMNAQIIEDILNQAKVDKNGRIMNKGRLNDMLHSEHLKAVKNCSIPDVVGQSEQLPCDRCEGKPESEAKNLCYECEVDLHGM